MITNSTSKIFYSIGSFYHSESNQWSNHRLLDGYVLHSLSDFNEIPVFEGEVLHYGFIMLPKMKDLILGSYNGREAVKIFRDNDGKDFTKIS